jgi:hypothetical protein
MGNPPGARLGSDPRRRYVQDRGGLARVQEGRERFTTDQRGDLKRQLARTDIVRTRRARISVCSLGSPSCEWVSFRPPVSMTVSGPKRPTTFLSTVQRTQPRQQNDTRDARPPHLPTAAASPIQIPAPPTPANQHTRPPRQHPRTDQMHGTETVPSQGQNCLAVLPCSRSVTT